MRACSLLSGETGRRVAQRGGESRRRRRVMTANGASALRRLEAVTEGTLSKSRGGPREDMQGWCAREERQHRHRLAGGTARSGGFKC